MIKVENLSGGQDDRDATEFPEPEGEILEVMDHNTRHDRLTLLTRITAGDDGGVVIEEGGEDEPEPELNLDPTSDEICGVTKHDDTICTEDPEECPWHDEEDQP